MGIELLNRNSMDAKLHTNVETASVHSPDFNYEDGDLGPQKGSTKNDVHDMSRMGKRQELRVGLRLLKLANSCFETDNLTRETSDSCQSLASS